MPGCEFLGRTAVRSRPNSTLSLVFKMGEAKQVVTGERVPKRPNRLRRSIAHFRLNFTCNRFFMISGCMLYLVSLRHSKIWRELRSSTKLISPSDDEPKVYVRWYLLHRSASSFRSPNIGLLMAQLGRFGNAARHFVGGIGAAHALGLGHVFIHGDTVFSHKSDYPRQGVHEPVPNFRVWIDQSLSSSAPKIDAFISWRRGMITLTQEASDLAWEIANTVLATPNSTISLPKETLVIHLRGGDVFGTRGVLNYGQPPLAYYQSVLAHRAWSQVIIVHQDERNPVLEPLLAWCYSSGVSAETFSQSLDEDIQLLLRAQNLVAGRGTFIPAIAGLSRNLTNLYCFVDKCTISPPRSGVTLWKVDDFDGTYKTELLSSNWVNSAAQKDLMLDYPVTKLHIQPPQAL